jgi:lipopolysaccharide transport system ATP-binding protein
MKAIVSARNVSKRYHFGKTLHTRPSLAEVLGSTIKRFRRSNGGVQEAFFALKGISFEAMPGEVIGIIGRNGAGKSTLLRILARITKPTTGEVDMYGRLGALLEIGTGFHPDLTGRENIFLNGTILGMKSREIRRQFDEIVAFSEIEKFLDTPVKHYSSGMYLRLAFAIAAHFEPDVLLLDEIIAVGDISFQKKCFEKMEAVRLQGRTIFLVSHDLATIQRWCQRVLFLQAGRLCEEQAVKATIEAYVRDEASVTSLG